MIFGMFTPKKTGEDSLNLTHIFSNGLVQPPTMGVSQNRGTSKWIVYTGRPY